GSKKQQITEFTPAYDESNNSLWLESIHAKLPDLFSDVNVDLEAYLNYIFLSVQKCYSQGQTVFVWGYGIPQVRNASNVLLLRTIEDRNIIVTVFDASNLESLSTCQRWMDDAVAPRSPRLKSHQLSLRMANLLQAEYWPISSKSGENVETIFPAHGLSWLLEIGLANETIVHPSQRDSINGQKRLCKLDHEKL
ncbi:Ras-related protein Rab-36, partial [Orchesella cincta]